MGIARIGLWGCDGFGVEKRGSCVIIGEAVVRRRRHGGHPASAPRALASPPWSASPTPALQAAQLLGVRSPERLAATGHPRSMYCIAFCADGRMLVAGSGDHDTFVLRNAQSLPRIGSSSGSGGAINSVAFTPRGQAGRRHRERGGVATCRSRPP